MVLLNRWRRAALAMMAMQLFVLPAQAAELQLQEQEIKAGLIYNFLKYTDWPPGSMPPPPAKISVCLFGDEAFNAYLQPMAGRSVNQREIALRTVRNIAEAVSCQLLFVNRNEQKNWASLREALAGKSVLTVGDFAEFADQGGMIEFGSKDNHIHVMLNREAAAAARLNVQDRLLKLVTVVR